MSRRNWLKLMAGSMTASLLPACQAPPEEIVPYVSMREYTVPGEPVFYGSMLTLSGSSIGVLVETHNGRPVKIEGNPRHPASLGATDIFSQAALVSLYDPARARTVTSGGSIGSWDSFTRHILERRKQWQANGGKGLRILTTTVSSPTLAAQLGVLQRSFPESQWHEYEPINRDHSRRGSRLAWGEELDATYDFAKAEVVLALDAHFLAALPGTLRYARDFSRGRQPDRPAAMNRLYCIESQVTPTGVLADHRLPVPAREVEVCTRALAAMFGLGVAAPVRPELRGWLEAVADDLRRHAGKGILIAGERQPAIVHALVHAMNEKLGNIGTTVLLRAPVTARAEDHMQSLQALVRDMRAGAVESLIILDGNPAWDTPADLEFAALLRDIRDSVHWSLYRNETSEACRWHVPAAHELESWGDGRAFDGTVSIRQPVIVPLFGGQAVLKITALLNGGTDSDYAAVRTYWMERTGLQDAAFEDFWRQALLRGFVEDTAAPVRQPVLRQSALHDLVHTAPPAETGLEISFSPDFSIWDGRFRRNSWLQELPKPVTSLTWDNALLVNPQTAGRLQLRSEDVVEIELRQRRLRAAVLIVSEQPEDTLNLSLGYGGENIGGANAFLLQDSAAPWFAAPLALRRTGERYPLALVQHDHRMDAQQPVRHAEFAEFRRNPGFIGGDSARVSLYPEPDPAREPAPEPAYAWGMSINLNSCIGCNACTIACQSENNIPSVGKDEVLRGHEMHWIRVDHYEAETGAGPAGHFQPVPCMHCENAPCEYVCPVGATVHDSEGLNAMVYNRCIGTRDCSQNCPYKVRRFNWLDYNGYESPAGRALEPLRNPDVTVRSRGVMEKCTYCVQRISQARRDAKKEGRTIRDGEVQTACQAVCPTEAIVFGNLNDADSRVTREKSSPLDYQLLAELNTRPRTSYKAHISNPNPLLQPGEKK